jgi:hypothetical protein
MDNRGVSPVVGKTLAASIAVLYIAGMTALLLNGPVPAGRTAAGGELGERVLATAGGHVESAVPDSERAVAVTTAVPMPATIRDASYTLELRGGRLVLDHPVDALDRETRLALPANVTVADGTWQSTDRLVVRVAGPPDNRTLWLEGDR